MVTVFLRGRLGNQMFQYALGLALAKKNATTLLLDTVHVRDRFPRPGYSYSTYALDVFAIEPRFTALSRVADMVPIPGVWLGLDLFFMALKERFGGRKVLYEEEGKGFDANVLRASGDIILYGRWENEKYFADIADDIRAAFRFRDQLEGPAAKVAGEIARVNSVSLHVRRGDYTKFKNVEKLMGKTDIGYYHRAATRIAAEVKDPHFFVFSDDAAWVRENIALEFPTTYLDDATAGPKASYHLQLMSLCKHHVITNSTFSWWGAWLDTNPKKIVVAPKQWSTREGGDRGIVPEGWIRT